MNDVWLLYLLSIAYKEEWKPVTGFEGLYDISNHGRIRNRNGKIISQHPDGYKLLYGKVNLYKKGERKNIRVHRLVAEHFCKNPYNKPEVNHEDVNPHNNFWWNLTWCTRVENEQHKQFMRGCLSVEKDIPMNQIIVKGY